MKNKVLPVEILLIALWLISPFESTKASPVAYLWSLNPINIDIKVGTEQQISIPGAERLQVGVHDEINRSINVQIIGHHIWLTANEEFENSRVIIVADPLGRLILQVNSIKGKVLNQPIVIQQNSVQGETISKDDNPHYGYVALTRWVVQQLYAPERLLTELQGVNRIPVESTELDLFRCGQRFPTLCAGAVAAKPIASWQSRQYYVTAVEVTNKLLEPIVLDARELRGNWRTAAFIHEKLRPSGLQGDSTVLIFISDFPFEYSNGKSMAY